MKKIIVLILLVILIPAYIFYQKNSKEEKLEMESKKVEESNEKMVQEVSPSPSTTTYSISEVEKHSVKEDCWLAIEGKVYDVSKFTMSGKHPGGDAILQGCGKDATVLFNTRPMGSGTPHSDRARDNLSNFLIGDLAK